MRKFLLAAICATVASMALAADHHEMSIDQVGAFFQKGIVPKKAKVVAKATGKPPKHNQVYSVEELTAQFGKPEARQAEKTRHGIHECWTYNCKDGVIGINFAEKAGGSEAGAEKTQRLEILGYDKKRGMIAVEDGRYVPSGSGIRFQLSEAGKERIKQAKKQERQEAKAATKGE